MSGHQATSAALAGIPEGLRKPLLEEYNKLAKNYREDRWEPAELNGGRFAEVVYSILDGHTSGTFASTPFKPANMVDACRNLENATSFPRSIRILIPRTLLALYEIRNNRNVGHVGSDVDPNHMDATIVFSMVKWVMAELVRVFHSISPEEATKVVEGLTERALPILWQVGGVTRVLGGLGAKEKTLTLLYSAAGPVSVSELLRYTEYTNGTRYRTSILKKAHKADLLHFDQHHDTAEISPVGAIYVEVHIPLEL